MFAKYFWLKNKLLVISFVVLLIICLYNIPKSVPYFPDIDWYIQSAANNLHGQFNFLGIPTSITWLNQGIFWSLFLAPVLQLSKYLPVSAIYSNIIISLFSTPLVFYLGSILKDRKFGTTLFIVWNLFFFTIFNYRVPYHTSPLFYLVIITFLLLLKNKYFYSGIFLGFMYQTHLLTFIYWPIILLIILRKNDSKLFFNYLLGFIIGTIPFLVSGLIPTFGIFAWIVYKTIFRFSNVGILSDSYFVVMSPIVLFVLAWLIYKAPKLLFKPILLIYIFLNILFIYRTNYLLNVGRYTPNPSYYFNRFVPVLKSNYDYRNNFGK